MGLFTTPSNVAKKKALTYRSCKCFLKWCLGRESNSYSHKDRGIYKMYYLKDYPKHLEAYKYMLAEAEKLNYDITAIDDMFYVTKLMQLDTNAVGVFPAWKMREEFPAFNTDFHGVFYVYLFPYTADDYEPESLPGDCTLQYRIDVIENVVFCHPKKDAADYCGVTVRQIERWMSGDRIRQQLPYFKHSKDRIFIESDLWDFMTHYAVGERWKHRTGYVPGENIEFRKK